MVDTAAGASGIVVAAKKCKVVILGDEAVGKTSLITRYVQSGSNLEDRYQATIGVDFFAKTVRLRDGGTMRLQLWDTAGQERYKSLARSYVRDAAAAILVYDVTKRSSLDGIRGWAETLRAECGDQAVLIVVGNKTDLEQSCEVATDVGRREAQDLGAQIFMETSAKEGNNVEVLFQEVALALPTASMPRRAEGAATLKELPRNSEPHNSDKCSC
mmetsp:Transcript_102611/g.203708  ORF Transcript_102611/g.203708 Transcript_102611/m.203708 type:complete len:215 (+) Transcript_102611:57-701(+)